MSSDCATALPPPPTPRTTARTACLAPSSTRRTPVVAPPTTVAPGRRAIVFERSTASSAVPIAPASRPTPPSMVLPTASMDVLASVRKATLLSQLSIPIEKPASSMRTGSDSSSSVTGGSTTRAARGCDERRIDGCTETRCSSTCVNVETLPSLMASASGRLPSAAASAPPRRRTSRITLVSLSSGL